MILLNGKWETGLDRNYTDESNVPGLIYSACEPIEGTLWYKREITLPEGNWTKASLILYGARYMPKVYINGKCVSSANGGLTVTRHLLDSEDIEPGNTVTMEIELASFTTTPDTDASKLPEADDWRSDLSSHIWNDVYLDLHNDVRIDSVITDYDEEKDALNIRYKISSFGNYAGKKITFTLYDKEEIISSAEADITEKGICQIPLNDKCKLWSPEEPNLYILKTEADGTVKTQRVGIKTFKKDGKGFTLNGNPVTLRMASMCWHRWQRDSQAKEIAYDENWFLNNVLLPLKKMGANTLRFHLGPVPERYMELCDEYGMLIQSEWSFFHGLKASAESLREQWTNWLDMVLKHIGVCVIHPWNEVFECKELADARDTLADIIKDYPDFILSHRDVMHIHKYWWSMFENVGVYYDDKDEFPMAVLADEFGGNYLDYEYNPGLYPELNPAFLRFLGENHTAEDRKWLQKVSHAKISEYWRRIGVAGFAPFCMISGPEDGNTYFEGNLKEGKFKPVFNELKAAYTPVSVSMNVWDRNFCPGQKKTVQLHFFNDTKDEKTVTCTYGIEGEKPQGEINLTLKALSKELAEGNFRIPEKSGEYTLYAAVGEAVSRWDIIVTELNSSVERVVGVHSSEDELIEFLDANNIKYTTNFSNCDVIVGLEETYNLLKTDKTLKSSIESSLKKGISVAILSAGPKVLGEGYEADSVERIQKVRRVDISELESTEIAFGISVSFKGASEPESCVHSTGNMNELWENINRKSMWLWNGLRGGLIVPAVDMSVDGNDKESFEKMWTSKGADTEKMKKSDYFAYELEGYYEYSEKEDENVKNALRQQVRFVVEDAPSLKDCIDTEAEITVTNLYKKYNELASNEGKIKYIDVVKAGKNLLRTPCVAVEFEDGKGRLLISQMMFDGRLANKCGGFFDLRNDVAASQLIVNIIKYL